MVFVENKIDNKTSETQNNITLYENEVIKIRHDINIECEKSLVHLYSFDEFIGFCLLLTNYSI